MIICEERAFERILSLGFCDTAIPISIRKEVSGEAYITVLPSLKKAARDFEKKFAHDYFSTGAHEWLRSSIRPFMFSIGYEDNRQSRKITEIMSRKNKIPLEHNDCDILKTNMPNLTSADVSSLVEFGHIVSAKIIDGRIVSVAYTNLNPTDCSAVEIGVETAPGYRRCGYAKRVLSTLINELENMDIAPIYVTSKNNYASIKLAKSIGFECEALEYNYVFRRI